MTPCSLEETCQYFGRICSSNLLGCLATIFCHVTPCTLQCKYQFLWRTCNRHLKDVSSRFLRKVFAYLPKYTASHFRTYLVCSRFMCLLQVMRNLNASFFNVYHPEVFNTCINKYTMMQQSNTTNFIIFIIVLWQHVSILIESSFWDPTAHFKHC